MFRTQTRSYVNCETYCYLSNKDLCEFDAVRYLSKGSPDPVTYMEVTETVGRLTRCMFSLWLISRLPGSLLPQHRSYLRLKCNMLVVQGILTPTL